MAPMHRRGRDQRPPPGPAILFVEDEAELRELTAEKLRRIGFRLTTAPDAVSALMLCRDHDIGIDVLLTDISMPGVSGGELARAATELRPGMKVVYASGLPREQVVQHGWLRAGATFVAKPYTTDDLAAALRSAVIIRP